MKPDGASARLLMLQVRTSSTWQTSAYNYSYLYAGINGDGHFGSGTDGFGGGVRLCRVSGGDVGVSPATGHGWSGSIRFNPASSYMRAFDIRGGYFLVTGAPLMLVGFGNWGSNSSVVAIRLIWDSGNFANTGRTRLLKIRE